MLNLQNRGRVKTAVAGPAQGRGLSDLSENEWGRCMRGNMALVAACGPRSCSRLLPNDFRQSPTPIWPNAKDWKTIRAPEAG